MQTAFNIGGGIVGLAAAIVWFWAARKGPQPGEPGAALYDVVPSPNTPFAEAWHAAARLNKLAAALTGVSVLLLALAALVPSNTAQGSNVTSLSVLLSSAVVAAVVSGIIALLTSERRLAAENVIQERKNWREKVRKLAADVHKSITSGDTDTDRFGELRAQFALRLNPHDPDDQEILSLVAPGDSARADEFNQRLALLLKHDWERAKRDANLLFWLLKSAPVRVRFQDYQPGQRHTYTRWRWPL